MTFKDKLARLGRVETRAIAIKEGYKALTTSYDVTEYPLLAAVCKDMARGNSDYLLVPADLLTDRMEVWKKGITSEAEFKEILEARK